MLTLAKKSTTRSTEIDVDSIMERYDEQDRKRTEQVRVNKATRRANRERRQGVSA